MTKGTLLESLQLARRQGLIDKDDVQLLFDEAKQDVPVFHEIVASLPDDVAEHWCTIPLNRCDSLSMLHAV